MTELGIPTPGGHDVASARPGPSGGDRIRRDARAHACGGENLSPPVARPGVPAGTGRLPIVCDDVDAPRGIFRHRAACNIPPDGTGLAAGCGPETREPGFMQAINDFGRPGHGGPCPPPGDSPHARHVRVSALSDEIVSAAPPAGCIEIQTLARPMRLGFHDG